jgi:hypothetical protein
MNLHISDYLAVTFCVLMMAIPSYAQKRGCTDRFAKNYNPSATINNGTCVYSPTTYTPPVKVDTISNILNESSGLQMAGDYLWSFNDGGGAAAIYRIDTASNAILQTVNLEDAANVDWEDIAFDGTYFYVGDFGNNMNGARKDLKIYKFPFSEIPPYAAKPVVTIPKNKIEVISFKYRNQQDPVASGINKTRYDCEAMIVDNNKIHLFSKNWVSRNTTHYVINSIKAGSYIADSLETLPTNYLVTGADKVPGQNLIVFIGYSPTLPGKHFMHILNDFSGGKYFNGNKRRLDLPDASQMGQAEGITFRNDRYGYISNERLSFGSMVISQQKLRSFNIINFISTPSKGTLTSSFGLNGGKYRTVSSNKY